MGILFPVAGLMVLVVGIVVMVTCHADRPSFLLGLTLFVAGFGILLADFLAG